MFLREKSLSLLSGFSQFLPSSIIFERSLHYLNANPSRRDECIEICIYRILHGNMGIIGHIRVIFAFRAYHTATARHIARVSLLLWMPLTIPVHIKPTFTVSRSIEAKSPPVGSV